MCGGNEQLNQESLSSLPSSDTTNGTGNLTGTVDAESSLYTLLEFSANNDIEGFERSFTDTSLINEIGTWYGRQRTSKKMVCEDRTPLMIAARYGSVDIVKLIVSLSEADVNFSCGPDKSTALHCAASGGSADAVEVVKILLLAGADPNVTDVNGHRPFDVIVAPFNRPDLEVSLEELLKDSDAVGLHDIHVASASLVSPSSSPDRRPVSSVSHSILSQITCEKSDINVTSAAEKKEYPVDPSLPDIKNSTYATDVFRMYSFKIRPCSRAYSHDWTECPFAHPGENARRRDPRKYHYSCVPCPDFRKGTCKHGDMCEYAHGVFECWLHPAQYRTRLCKDGVCCARRVCFFAHTAEELRPLYMSTGSAVPSSQALAAAGVMDMAVALGILPGSPSSASAMSPSGNGIAHSSMAWSQQNVPNLHLSGSNFQSSRLRSSLSPRGIPPEDLNMLHGFEMQQHHLNDMSGLSQQHLGTSSPHFHVRPKAFLQSNLPELFTNEISSPRYSDQLSASSLFSPTHKSTFLNQLQQQQNMLSPIKTKKYSGKNVNNPFFEGSFGASSPGWMSPRSIETLSPMNSCLSPSSHHENQQQQLRSLTSRELGSNLPRDFGSTGSGLIGSPVNNWPQWNSPNGKVDWSVQAGELGSRRSCSIGHNGEEPDVSWVQSLVKESSHGSKEIPAEGANSKSPSDSSHAALGAWIEKLQIDQATNGRK